MSDFLFPSASVPSLAIDGRAQRLPLHRIYCVGRNYAEHVREMGGTPDAQRPVFFMKPADAIVESGARIPFPLATSDLHHEVELVVALGQGGSGLGLDQAKACIAAFAVGVDLTRRDLQLQAKKSGQPWDTSKGFDNSAPVGPLVLAANWAPAGQSIRLWLDDELRQDGRLDQMIMPVPQIIAALSELYELRAGDLIFTGTPHGVGPLLRGQRVRAVIDGLPELTFELAP